MKKVSVENGESLLIHEIEINSTVVTLCAHESEFEGESLITEFITRIPLLWSNLYSTMESEFNDYGHSEDFPPSEFFMTVSRMTDVDVFMGEKSDFLLRFEFDVEKFSDSIPIYDFFLDREFKVVHDQVVF